jgi:hypothetical protein
MSTSLTRNLREIPSEFRKDLTMYTRHQAAALYHASPSWVDRATKQGLIKSTRIGGKVLYSARNLAALAA